jgi:molybdopterin molybdotransferase
LPGNPAAALAVTVVLVRPVVARLLATRAPVPTTARLGASLTSPGGRRELVAARSGRAPGTVVPLSGHGSADLRRLAATEALVDVGADVTRLAVDEDVDVWWLS